MAALMDQPAETKPRFLIKPIPICPAHGVAMKQYGHDPDNPGTRYYKCPLCEETGKGVQRVV